MNERDIIEQAGSDLNRIADRCKRNKRRRFWVKTGGYVIFFALFIWATAVCYYKMDASIPSTIYLHAGKEEILRLKVPATGAIKQTGYTGESNIPKQSIRINLNHPVTFIAGSATSYDMQVKLFGILPFKQVDIKVVNEKELIPVGMPIGLYLKTDGVMVVGIGQVEGENHEKISPAKNKLKSGDYIKEINGNRITSKKEIVDAIAECEGEGILFGVERDNELMDVFVVPEKNLNGEYKAGIWIRDNTQGVGTMTYMDSEGNFGALGHGINDVDTGELLELCDGTLYSTQIIGIKKGLEGDPGELTGKIIYSNEHIIGEINENSKMGIFGNCNMKGRQYATEDSLPIGLKQEIVKGPAQIICAFEDGVANTYQVEITKIHINHDNINRGIELQVTDKSLIEKTGGIVQGMSGSPIVQNGRIVGAVTHVLVNDPTRGYGIFIENMLEH